MEQRWSIDISWDATNNTFHTTKLIPKGTALNQFCYLSQIWHHDTKSPLKMVTFFFFASLHNIYLYYTHTNLLRYEPHARQNTKGRGSCAKFQEGVKADKLLISLVESTDISKFYLYHLSKCFFRIEWVLKFVGRTWAPDILMRSKYHSWQKSSSNI